VGSSVTRAARQEQAQLQVGKFKTRVPGPSAVRAERQIQHFWDAKIVNAEGEHHYYENQNQRAGEGPVP
jgi:hypothetical protein